MSSQKTPLPSGNMPSGTPPLGGKSSQLAEPEMSSWTWRFLPSENTRSGSDPLGESLFRPVKTEMFPSIRRLMPPANMLSGNPPLGGRSSQLVKTGKSPSTGTFQPSGKSLDQLHQDDMFRALKAEKKISRLEAELAQTRNELAQTQDRVDDLEAASDLKDRQLRAALEHGDRPSTVAEDQKVAMLEADLAQAQEQNLNSQNTIENLQATYELQIQDREQFIGEQNSRISEPYRKQGLAGISAASASNNATELRDLTNAALKRLHTVIAVGETYTRNQDLKLESLRSAAHEIDILIEQAEARAEYANTHLRTSYEKGRISREYRIKTEEKYRCELEFTVSMRQELANYMKEQEGSIATLKEVYANARSKYGRAMTNLGITTQNAGITSSASQDTDSTDIKQVSDSERGDMQQGDAKAADACEPGRRKIGTPPTPKPKKPLKSPAEFEMLRLAERQTLHSLDP